MLAVIITVVVSLALSAFFSGMEIAFLSSNKLKLEIEKKQSRAFGYVAGLFSKYPGQYITTILVGNNLALVIYSLQMSVLIQLQRRLEGRGTDSPETIARRVAKAELELAFAPQFDRVVVNDCLATAVAEAEQITEAFIG